MKKKLAWGFMWFAVTVGALPAQAGPGLPSEVPCDGDFHLVERFTKGRRTSAQDPTFAADKLWLLQGYDDERQLRQALKVWNGKAWTAETVPQPQEGEYYISGFDVTADGVAWLAGSHQTDATRPLVLRFDGNTWEQTPVPEMGPDAPLWDIDMWSPNEGWAVGHYEVDQEEWALTLQWNGGAWEHVDSPGKGPAADLTAVSMASPTDIWAMHLGGDPRRAIHWNGVTWSSHPLPDPEPGILNPIGVDAVRENRAWVAGSREVGRAEGVILSWNGERWSRRLSTRTKGHTFLHAIDVSPGGWAVGENRTRQRVRPVALRKTGSRWVPVRADSPGRGGHLNDVVNADGTAWATGRASSNALGLYGTLQKACL